MPAGQGSVGERGLAMSGARRPAFTIIELLIVIVIVAMLLTLMAPAVQHVRESARDMDCSNRLRQIGIAIHAHEQAHKILPTNGWGYEWIGNPNRGFRRTQPGGWVYNILPYMEQSSVRDLGRGMVAGSSTQKKAALQMVQTVIPGFNCPDRHRNQLLPITDSYEPKYSDPILEAQRTDYAINGGQANCSPGAEFAKGPQSFADAKTSEWVAEFMRMDNTCTGVAHFGSEVRIAQITDGLSKTYLVGEKYLDPQHYLDGRGAGDKRTMLEGANEDITRWGSKPKPDTPGKQNGGAWGGPHPEAFNMLYCDGSVRNISFSIKGSVHEQAANRSDGAAEEIDEAAQ